MQAAPVGRRRSGLAGGALKAGLWAGLWLGWALPGTAPAGIVGDGDGDGQGLRALGLRVEGTWNGNRHFREVEFFGRLPLPWRAGGDLAGWRAETYLEGSAGRLGDGNEEGAALAVGPGLRVGRGSLPFYLDLGIAATWLSHPHYRRRDLGGPFQFTSHLGLGVELGKGWTVAYRFQHLSNADLYDRNPGLDMHGISVSRQLP